MRLTKVTLSGVDETVHPVALCALFDDYPFVEFGILRSVGREGKEPRYPGRVWIDKAIEGMSHRIPLSFHLCGSWTREAVSGPFTWAVMQNHEFQRANRIQLNIANNIGPTLLDGVKKLADAFDRKFIIQIPQACWIDYLNTVGLEKPHRVQYLIDASGGTGKRMEVGAEDWPDVFPCRVGFAGGFGPDNIHNVLSYLSDRCGDGGMWVDMESSLRDANDGFDLMKARKVLDIAKEFIQ